MRKALLLLLSALLLLPLVSAQPYVTVFEGRLAPGQMITVGDYSVTIVTSAVGNPYLMLKKGSEILELKPFEFGGKVERDGIRVVMGSYTPQGGFLVISVKPKLVASLKPKVGEKASFNGTTVEVTSVDAKTVGVSVNGVLRTLKANESTVVDLFALEYDGKEIRVYVAEPASKTVNVDYTVFYPYKEVKTSGPVDLPITVTSSSNVELNLKLGILSLPSGWKASFLYGGVEVREITVPPRGTVGLTLHIEPSGSGVIEFTVGSVTGSLKVESTGVEASLPYLSVEAEAGTSVSVPVTFTGRGEVEFTPGNVSPVWDVYLTDGRYRLRSFEVDGSFTAELVVEIPRNATIGNHRVEFEVNGRSYALDVYVYKTYLGEPAKLTVVLTDESGNPLRGWVSVGGENVTVSPAGSATFELKPGEYTVLAGAEGSSPAKEDVKLSDGEEKTLTIKLKRAEYYFKATLERDALVIRAGSGESVAITVKNLGSRDDEYRVAVEGLPEGWNYILSQDPKGTVPIASIKVPSGKSGSTYLVILPPFNAESGDFNITVTVSGSGSKVELPLKVHVENQASLRVNVDNPTLSVRAGGSTATTIWLDAMGTVTNVKFTVQAPSGWDVEVVPSTIPRIGMEGKNGVYWSTGPTQAELRIRVPKSAPAGTYTITVTAAGDQAKAETVVTVRVTQGSGGTWIGVLLLVAAFGVVIWLMRRVGRR
ncbi:COG1470 family protein [Thermococcus stetteri]|uniref:COG1470 family protein n=1 Tax=Thermococcus stetteri TaxID=49900 RepID=UPI001AE677D6|nr:NEW3 domain-containing protein [Thermococcus stetteri]MBP1911013.1 putative membrane protein [Thermococcus stetteri]